jgi:hypothetical protein
MFGRNYFKFSMSLRTQHEFLFLGRDDGNFVENYAYDLGEGGESSGRIFINLEIQNNPAEAETIGDVIFDTVRKAFFADLEKDPYLRFEDAIKMVNHELNTIRDEKSSKYIGNLNVLIAAVAGNNLYITQSGEAEAYLIRRRLCTAISEGLSEDGSGDIFANIASGSLEPNDYILLSSTRILRYISKTDLSKVFASKNLVASFGELKDLLGSEVLTKVGLIGVAIVEKSSFSEDEKGKIVAHLEKEEVVSMENAPSKSGSIASLKNAVSRLSTVVDDLRRKVTSAKSSVGGAVKRGEPARLPTAWTKDRILAAVIVAVLFLTVGVFWLKNRANEQQTIDKYTTILSEVREKVASAETTGQYNKDQAGQLLNQAEKDALDVINSGYMRAKANEMLQLVKDARDKLDGVLRPEAKVLVDLSQKRPNVSALGILGIKGNLFAFEYNALYPIVLDKVQDPMTIDENETVIVGTVYDDKDSLMFYTKSGKVVEYKDNRMAPVDTADEKFHPGVSVQGYSNKLYVLDAAQNQIWRYTRRRDKFDAAEAWNINADVKNGVSLAIDGNIYVLNSDGSITKIFSGNKQDFPIKKQPINPPTKPTKIFTELDMSQIYVLEPSTSRIFIYYKDERTGGATYSSQLVFEDLTDLRDLYVDKDTNKLYLLDATKVYTVGL